MLSIPSQTNLTISLSVGGRERHLDRHVMDANFNPTKANIKGNHASQDHCPECRPKDEPLNKALGRLQKSFSDAEQGDGLVANVKSKDQALRFGTA